MKVSRASQKITMKLLLLLIHTRKNHLKIDIREKRGHGKHPVRYHIADETNIQHIPLSRFLSHDQTKSDLAMYLAKGTSQHNMHSSKCVIVSASGKTNSNMQILLLLL